LLKCRNCGYDFRPEDNLFSCRICKSDEADIIHGNELFIKSIAEGDDKPGKYPMLFREAKAVLLNKTDLIPYTNFNIYFFRTDLQNINARIPLFEISCIKGDGLPQWYRWIQKQLIDSGRIISSAKD
jgi:hydrogenase nickel incorporation protein HypB